MPARRTDVTPYQDLIYPTLKAVAALGGSAQGREITAQVIEDLKVPDETVAITYPNRPSSVFISRLGWARSYAKLGGALDSPQRGLFVLTSFGREILTLPEAVVGIAELSPDSITEIPQVLSGAAGLG